MFSTSLLSSVLLALAVSANPVITIRDAPITLKMSRSLNTTGFINLNQNDFNCVQALNAHGMDAVANEFFSTPAMNRGSRYIAQVGVGSPPTMYELVVSTGSPITWVGASKKFVKTGSSIATPKKLTVKYIAGEFIGALYTDTVTLASGFAVRSQPVGVASSTKGFACIDGMLGLGPRDLSAGTISPGSSKATIPTVTDNLFGTHMIPANMFAIAFQPLAKQAVIAGQLTWGAVDSSKYTGSITYVPITTTSPASKYWGIKQTITYGKTPILRDAAGILDTSSTLLSLASDGFSKYKTATGATLDPVTKLLTITPAGFAKMQSLFFTIGSTTFELIPNAQIWPRAFNTIIRGATNKIYLIVSDTGRKSGKDIDVINGYVWLERFYTVYDTANKRVGIANTPFTNAKTN